MQNRTPGNRKPRWFAALAAAVPAILPASASLANEHPPQRPESAEYDAQGRRHLVSDVTGGAILARDDAGGYRVFTDDPARPFGIELLDGTLFVLDSGRLKGYARDGGAKVLDLAIEGAGFLNGIASNGIDTLYLSDMEHQRIHQVQVGDLAAPVHTPLAATGDWVPNGLVYDDAGGRLLIATWGENAAILSLDLTPGATPRVLIRTRLTNIDGIALDRDRALYATPWANCGHSDKANGCLVRFQPPFSLDSAPQLVAEGLRQPADIDYNPDTGEIAVPESGAPGVSLHPVGK